jgi:hypothetical protein
MHLRGVSRFGGDDIIPFRLFGCNYLLYPSFIWQPSHQDLTLARFEVLRCGEKPIVFLCPLQELQRYTRFHPSLSPSMDVQVVASFPRNNSLVIYGSFFCTKTQHFVGIIMAKRNIKPTS